MAESGEDIKLALIGWAREVLLWFRRLERWLEVNLFVEVFPVPGSRATTRLYKVWPNWTTLDEMVLWTKRPVTDDSYQVSVHLALRFKFRGED